MNTILSPVLCDSCGCTLGAVLTEHLVVAVCGHCESEPTGSRATTPGCRLSQKDQWQALAEECADGVADDIDYCESGGHSNLHCWHSDQETMWSGYCCHCGTPCEDVREAREAVASVWPGESWTDDDDPP